MEEPIRCQGSFIDTSRLYMLQVKTSESIQLISFKLREWWHINVGGWESYTADFLTSSVPSSTTLTIM